MSPHGTLQRILHLYTRTPHVTLNLALHFVNLYVSQQAHDYLGRGTQRGRVVVVLFKIWATERERATDQYSLYRQLHPLT